jgi:hypothetical protein
MSCGGQAGGWLLDYGLVEEEIQGSEFIYMVDDPAVSSVILGFDAPRKEDGVQDNPAAKKRSRPESSAPPGTKACREKLRRDRLNERCVPEFRLSVANMNLPKRRHVQHL